MGQQMADRDRVRVCGKRQILRDRIIDRQLLVFRKDENRRRGELLRDGRETVIGIGPGGDALLSAYPANPRLRK